MPRLNKRFIDSLPKKPLKDQLYRDDELIGFALRVKPSGTRTWLIQYRNRDGGTRKLAFAKLGVLTPEEARKEAKKLLGRVALGEDPSAIRHANRAAKTVADLCEEYLDATKRGLVLNKRREAKSNSTVATDEGRIVRHILPLLGKKKIDAVQPPDIRKFIQAIQEGKTAARVKTKPRGLARVTGGAGTATRTTGLLSGIFSYATKQGYRRDNPVHGVERPAYKKRRRFLSDEEYGALGASLDEASQSGENPLAISAIRAIALTGCRLQEIAKLRHDELDLQTSHLRIANGKEGYSVLPLGESAKAVLTAVPKQPKHPNSPYVFATNRGLPYTALPKAFKRIVEKAKLEGVTLHTLRHSFASMANMLGYTESTVGALLGHAAHSVTRGYIHIADEPLMRAADHVACAISGAMEGAAEKKFEAKAPSRTGVRHLSIAA